MAAPSSARRTATSCSSNAGRSHRAAASVGHPQRERAVQSQALRVPGEDLGMRFLTDDACCRNDVIVEPERDRGARVRAHEMQPFGLHRRRVHGIDEERHHRVVDARRHQDDVDESPAADPWRLPIQEHVSRPGAGGSQDRRTRTVAGERDTRATLATAQLREPSLPQPRRPARRDRTDGVAVLQPHERRRQTSRREGLHDRGRRRWVEVQPSRVGGPRDPVEALARQEVEVGLRHQIRGVRPHRRGEEDVVGDRAGSLDDGHHRRTVARHAHGRQTAGRRRFASTPARGTSYRSRNAERRRIR